MIASSSVYETEPVGEVTDQPDFLNACVRIETPLGPEELLDACKATERALGREPGGVRHGPRPVDVDVLLLGNREYASDRLKVPHREVGRAASSWCRCSSWTRDLRLPDGTSLAGRSRRWARARRSGAPGRRSTSRSSQRGEVVVAGRRD